MAKQTLLVAGGVLMLFHCAYNLVRAKEAGVTDLMSFEVVLQILAGAVMMLWGGLDDYKPIRAGDMKMPMWDTYNVKPDFQTFNGRHEFLASSLKIPRPPTG